MLTTIVSGKPFKEILLKVKIKKLTGLNAKEI